MKNGVSFPEFSEVLKQAYVDVAAAKMKGLGQEVTEQGISSMANVTIEDVRNMSRPEAAAKFDRPDESNPLPRILNAWHTDARYTGPYGVLKDLEFVRSGNQTSEGGPNFSTLVATYCPGIAPEVLLDQLIEANCVQPVGSDHYRAIKRSYVPDPLSAASILLFARVVHNLCEAAEVNLRSESASGRGLMQRNVYTRYGFTPEDLKSFDIYIRSRGQMFVDDIDNWLSDRDRESEKNTIKTGIGLFHFIVNDEDELELAKQLPN